MNYQSLHIETKIFNKIAAHHYRLPNTVQGRYLRGGFVPLPTGGLFL